MKTKSKIFLFLISFSLFTTTFAQDSSNTKSLEEVVVTGQLKPQFLKNSVYEVRTINQKRIALSGATNVQQVLNNQLGIRFSNDAILGSDIQINGVSGRSIKILIDGAPVLDRFDQKASLSQIDINTVEKIEIVEGPMAVSFGSDAMAGTINIITKKNNAKLIINVSLQEETAANEYHPLSYKGFHTQNINIGTAKNNWNLYTGITHNLSAGFGGDEFGRGKSWLPKEQYLGNVKLGYKKNNIDIYYRLDALNENIIDRNTINIDLAAFARSVDQTFTTNRFMHQLQSNIVVNKKLQLTTIAAFTDFKRTTKTEDKDFVNNTTTLGKLDGQQDVSVLKNFSIKNSLQYQFSQKITLQSGIDINTEKASGDRIDGSPSITDYALFTSVEYKYNDKINIRPGIRLVKNSIYKAPPILPALNVKFALAHNIDLRMSYGMGFRAPALRELYFRFVDANHNIVGNENLRVETSNNFTTSVNWQIISNKKVSLKTVLSAAYNTFKNQIDLAQNLNDLTQYSYFNINNVQTKSLSVNNTLKIKNIEASMGIALIGNATKYDASIYKNDSKNYFYSPEINSNIIYTAPSIKTSFGFFYKLVGAKQTFSYEPNENPVGLYVTKTYDYQLADFTITNNTIKKFSIQAGVKNLFDITNVNSNTIGNSSTSHSGDSNGLSINYGRSYFIGIAFHFIKK